MLRLVEYYISISLLGVVAAIMLYIVLLPLPVANIFAKEQSLPLNSTHSQIKSGIPTRLIVPSLGIDMPIKIGSFDKVNQTWVLNDTDIFFADASVPANDSNGTTLIYGHAKWGVFGVLPDLNAGATAQVYTSSGFLFNYRYTSVRETDPSDVSVFTNIGSPKLILQTCTGVWSDYRSLYSFDLVGAEKP